MILFFRKRAAAKQLIERYYYQLTDGCGSATCGNIHCASSNKFNYPDLSRNQAAVRALQLFKEKAILCGSGAASKIAKTVCSDDDPMMADHDVAQESLPSTSHTTDNTATRSDAASSHSPELPPFPTGEHNDIASGPGTDF